MDMFGREFLEKNTVFEFTNWVHDKKAVKKRQTQGKDEVYWKNELNSKLRELVGCRGEVPAVFIDALYDDEDDAEIANFNDDMDKLEQHLKSMDHYSCEGFEAVKTKLDQAEEDKARLAAEKTNNELENIKLEEKKLGSQLKRPKLNRRTRNWKKKRLGLQEKSTKINWKTGNCK